LILNIAVKPIFFSRTSVKDIKCVAKKPHHFHYPIFWANKIFVSLFRSQT